MKNIYRFFSLVFAVLAFAISIPHRNVLCFYSSAVQSDIVTDTGSVDCAIENLKLGDNEIILPKKSRGILNINASETFSFTVKNKSRIGIGFSLDIGLSWDADLPESGKLFVYPASMSDENIYENIKNSDYSGALLPDGVSDKKEIETSSGLSLGIFETVDKAVLPASGENSKDYELKLFFYEDAEIEFNPSLYKNKLLEINISVNADVTGKQTNWAKTKKAFFQTLSAIRTTPPVINEIAGHKTFFAAQSENLDLKAYASAGDETDGDLTDNIEITSFPQFVPGKSGVYKIIYNVKNSDGIYGNPLQITITVWDFIKIVSGNYHSLALTSHGKVYAWGRNVNGQLGDGSTTNKSAPQIIENLPHIIDVAACNSSSYALASDGQLYAWGHNGYGHLGDNSSTDKRSPVKVLQPEGITFTQVSARFDTAGAITADGDVYTWGYGGYGAAGTGESTEINRVPQKINISNISALEFGCYSGAAITKDGKLYTWGDNGYGQLGNGNYSETVIAPAPVPYFEDKKIKIVNVSAGLTHMTAISDDGRLFTWGYGETGYLGNGTTYDSTIPQHISLPSVPKKIVAGVSHSAVITAEGNVYLFGENTFGKLGMGDGPDLYVPTLLSGISKATEISLAPDSTFILTESKTLFGMGNGKYGALGTGNTNNSNIPIQWVFIPPNPY